MTNRSDCQRDGYTLVTTESQPVYEPVHGQRLTVADETITRGETLKFVLTNVSDEVRDTSGKNEYLFQQKVETQSGDPVWEDIWYEEDIVGRSLVEWRLQPDQTRTWTFNLTSDGQLTQADGSSLPGYLCPPLTPGTYRFVYWGLARMLGKETAPAVPFTVTNATTTT